MENELTDVVETTENTESTAVEENVELTDSSNEEVKMYSERELNERVDELLGKKIRRERRKIEREFENKYSDYMDIGNIVSKGVEATDIKDAKNKVKEFYKDQGIEFDKPTYSEREEKILGKSEADEIIDLGYEEMEEEANRLADRGYENLSIRDKEKFTVLAQTLTREKQKRELKEIGVENLLNDKEFTEFASNFKANTPYKTIYEIYSKSKPKKPVNTMGSMKGIEAKTEKETFTDEELSKLTMDELNDDRIWAKVRKSMTK